VRRSLSDQEIETIIEIVARSAGDDSPLVSALRNGRLTDTQEDELVALVTDELAVRGFDANYEPTPYGVQLESLIDLLNAT
jgi:hypothetical protein